MKASNRVPRKKKKHYKKLWEKRLGYKIKILKSSIFKKENIWRCMVEPINETDESK